MSRIKEFNLPDLGEGLTEGEILSWLVKVGDTIELNQPIVEVETAKAAVEIPAKWAGVVTRIFHEAWLACTSSSCSASVSSRYCWESLASTCCGSTGSSARSLLPSSRIR